MSELYYSTNQALGPSLLPQMVKYLSAMWETQVQSLDLEDPLENGMATHSNNLAWRIPWTEEHGRLLFATQYMELQKSDMT